MIDPMTNIFVTGGTSGIGRATVLRLAKDGAFVTFVGRNEQRGAEIELAAGSRARFVPGDLRQPGVVELVVRAALESGPLDAAVNAAAEVGKEPAPLGEIDDERFEHAFVGGTRLDFMCMRAELVAALEADHPISIVNVSSINGLGAAPRNPLYSAMKAAMLSLTKSIALDYGARGIRANAVVAGAFDTPMLAEAWEKAAGGDAERLEAMRRQFLAMVPAQRIGDPEDAAGTIAWLCSADSRYVNGASIIVDGGMTAYFR